MYMVQSKKKGIKMSCHVIWHENLILKTCNKTTYSDGFTFQALYCMLLYIVNDKYDRKVNKSPLKSWNMSESWKTDLENHLGD